MKKQGQTIPTIARLPSIPRTSPYVRVSNLGDDYLRPGGVDTYRRPGGVDLYKRP